MDKTQLLSDGETVYDPSNWLTKQEARERFGIPARTLERAKSIKKLYYRPANQREIAVFWARDLEQVAQRRAQPAPERRAETSDGALP